MSIKKFKQFINEGFGFNKERLSSYDKINNAYTKLIETSKNTFEKNIKKLTLQFPYIDEAMNSLMETYGDIIVGEPNIILDSPRLGYDMSSIAFIFNTDIPSSEYDEYEDKIDNFNKQFRNIGEDFYIEASNEGIDIYENIFEIEFCFLEGRFDDDTLTLQVIIRGLQTEYLIDFCKKNYVIDELNNI